MGSTVLATGRWWCCLCQAMAAKAGEIGWAAFWHTISEPNVLRLVWLEPAYVVLCHAHQYRVFGTLVAWVLVRYEFPGKNLVNALVRICFRAHFTVVTGIALVIMPLAAPNGWLGRWFTPFDIKIAFAPIAVSGLRWCLGACPLSCARCSRCWKNARRI